MGLISNGTTIFDNGSMASGFGGSLNFISKATASASASIEFTSGIDSTYKEYVFYFVNIHPSTDAVQLTFNLSTDNGSNYNVTKTTSYFRAYHNEDDAGNGLTYDTSGDLAQSTSYQWLTRVSSSDNDHASNGYLHLFNPSSNVYVKHFTARFGETHQADRTQDIFVDGYGNTQSPINAIKFQMSSGNIDAGEILLFGIN